MKKNMRFHWLITSVVTSAIIMVACNGATSNDDHETDNAVIEIKVGAYNVEFSKNATAEQIGEALKPYDFDVVCFSEAPAGDWTERVAAVLGFEHTVVGRYSTAAHVDKYKTIASRTALYDYEEVLMADTFHTATKAKTTIHGREFTVYAVHFPFGWRDQAHVDETTGKITDFVDHVKNRKTAEPYQLLMGDFNFLLPTGEKESPYYEMFLEQGFDATWNELGIDVTKKSTMVNTVPDEQSPGRVIDHILYDPLKAEAIAGGVIEMEQPLSDHKPVWATLKLKD